METWLLDENRISNTAEITAMVNPEKLKRGTEKSELPEAITLRNSFPIVTTWARSKQVVFDAVIAATIKIDKLIIFISF